MITPNRVAVLLLLLLIAALAAWSKLRLVDDDVFEAQRWRLDEHPSLHDQPSNTEKR